MDILRKSVPECVDGAARLFYPCRDGALIPVAHLNLLPREDVPDYCMTVLCRVPDAQSSGKRQKKQQIEDCTTKRISIPNTNITYCVNADGQGYFSAVRVSGTTMSRTCAQIGQDAFEPSTTVCLPKAFYYPPTHIFTKSGVKRVLVPQDAVEIQDKLFDACATMIEVQFAFGNQLQKIGASAFRKNGLKYFKLPPSVTKIGDMAFFMCKALESINLGNGIQKLARCASAARRT